MTSSEDRWLPQAERESVFDPGDSRDRIKVGSLTDISGFEQVGESVLGLSVREPDTGRLEEGSLFQ